MPRTRSKTGCGYRPVNSSTTPATRTSTPSRLMLIQVLSPAPPTPYATTAGEQRDDQVVRDGEQPPLHQHQAAREVLGVVDVQVCRVVGRLRERERRVAVGAERVGVVGDAPAPAQHADVEVEDRAGVAAGEQDREERHHAQHRERHPQEGEHHVVGEGEQPLHQPQPPAQAGVEVGVDVDGVGRGSGRGGHQESFLCGSPGPCVTSPGSRFLPSIVPPRRARGEGRTAPVPGTCPGPTTLLGAGRGSETEPPARSPP